MLFRSALSCAATFSLGRFFSPGNFFLRFFVHYVLSTAPPPPRPSLIPNLFTFLARFSLNRARDPVPRLAQIVQSESEVAVLIAESVGTLMNTRTNLTSTLLTVAATMYMGGGRANAASRCEADLGRVDNAFCIGPNHAAGATQVLTYSWKLDDKAFDLASKVCLDSGEHVGDRRDMVLALDRSEKIGRAHV